ncbi:hypothetical protein C8C96_2427 [Acidovorax sp. 100]|nr:hypothetical protein C8C96_2427 [Acidovorax sp. 100]
MTCYHPKKKTTQIGFWYWRDTRSPSHVNEMTPERMARIREIQYLMFLRIYRAERILNVKHLVGLQLALRDMAQFAEARDCSVREILEKTEGLDAYIAEVRGYQCIVLRNWIFFLQGLDPRTELGFEIPTPREWRNLGQRALDYQKSHKQHEPLPTRIYAHLINALEVEIETIEAHISLIQKAVQETDKLYQDNAKCRTIGNSFGTVLVENHRLKALLTHYGCEHSTQGLSGLLTNWQRIAKIQIHTFSGMRFQEVQSLPYYCMKFEELGQGHKTAWIVGTTTKLNGGRNTWARWVTTDQQGFRAIRVAQQVADMIYGVLGVKPTATESDKGKYPLFVSTGFLPWKKLQESINGGFRPSQNLHILVMPDIVQDRLLPVIELEDIEELDAIEPFRDWSTDPEFAFGKRWSLKSHQLRRSLALYANASGLVKSSTLRRQLKHLADEMGSYYGRGSTFAKNFLKEDEKQLHQHIAFDWEDGEQEAQLLAFTRDVINADEALYGPAGIYYDRRKERGEVLSEKELKKQLKQGTMAYKAHPLGGCTHVGNCDKQKGLRLTSGICVTEACKSLIGKHSAIIKVIQLQYALVRRLEPDSIGYAMESEELDILKATELQWRQKPAAGAASYQAASGADVSRGGKNV